MQKIVSLLLLSFLTFSLEAAKKDTFLADNSLTTVPGCRYSTTLNWGPCSVDGNLTVSECTGNAYVTIGPFCAGVTSLSDFSQFGYCSMGWCSGNFHAIIWYQLFGIPFSITINETRWFLTDPNCCFTGN
jgi:hypothetical protein